MQPTTKAERERALSRQIARLDARLASLKGQSKRLTRVRLTVFGVGVLLAIGAFFQFGILQFWGALLATFIAFSAVVAVHRQILASLERHQAWRRIKQTHMARMQLDWDALQEPLTPTTRDPLAVDLDLIGRTSLHRLLDTTVTQDASEQLYDWLIHATPDPQQITARQALVQELIPRTLLRDKLTLEARLSSRTADKWSATALRIWLDQQPADKSLRLSLIVLTLLAIANVTLFLLSAAGVVGSLWIVTFVPYVALTLRHNNDVQSAFAHAASMQDALRQLMAVFALLEARDYRQTPALGALCAPFRDIEHQPSRYVRRIGRIVAGLGIRGNGLVALLLNAVMPWDIFFTYQLDRQKSAIRDKLPAWLDAWFELEAASALGTFAYLNPHYTFARVSADGPLLQADALGHPLLPDKVKVTNDFDVQQLGEINLITGSNMAGKSTFLRTIGINLALAYAGSVVDAASLALRPLRMFTCIRVADSVTDGISYFYAEVKRLRALLDSLHEKSGPPLFYFIDEIFRGTNNRERLAGSTAFVRALAGSRGVGFISTHDLELVQLDQSIPALRNYHFRETVFDGRMVFDYMLRDGPCPTTNALEIMRLEGLPVPPPPPARVRDAARESVL